MAATTTTQARPGQARPGQLGRAISDGCSERLNGSCCAVIIIIIHAAADATTDGGPRFGKQRSARFDPAAQSYLVHACPGTSGVLLPPRRVARRLGRLGPGARGTRPAAGRFWGWRTGLAASLGSRDVGLDRRYLGKEAGRSIWGGDQGAGEQSSVEEEARGGKRLAVTREPQVMW